MERKNNLKLNRVVVEWHKKFKLVLIAMIVVVFIIVSFSFVYVKMKKNTLTNSSDKFGDDENINVESENNNDDNSNDSSVDDENVNKKPENSIDGYGCVLKVVKGTMGMGNWYVTDVTLDLVVIGENISGYGISTSSKPTYNGSKNLEITTDHDVKKYYGHIKYKDGTSKLCEIAIKVDKTKPNAPIVELVNSDWQTAKNDTWYNRDIFVLGGTKTNRYPSSTDVGGSGIAKYEISKDNKIWTEWKYDDYSDIYKISGSGVSYRYVRAVDYAGNVSNVTIKTIKVDKIKPTCFIKMSTGLDTDLLTVYADDSNSGISSFSYNNSSYTSNKTYNIKKGTKVKVSIKDVAGNIGNCQNYKQALILVGDSRTAWLQEHMGGKNNLTEYDDISFIESYDNANKEVYSVAKAGALINWFKGLKNFDSTGKNKVAGAYQVEYLLEYLSKKSIYYEIVIASNLGVNDLGYVGYQDAPSNYISAYNNLLNSSQKVFVDGQELNSSWKKRGNVIDVEFKVISVNPIDEQLLNKYESANKRTTARINNFNEKMKVAFGSNYLDAYSKFNDWFAQTIKNGQARFLYKECVDKNGNSYTCEDGIHYSEYMEKTYIYEFYKSKLLS